MMEKTCEAKSFITLRRVLATSAVLLVFALVFVVPAAAETTIQTVTVTTQNDLNNAITNVETNKPTIIILNGEYYTIFESAISSKNITFKGSRNTVLHAKDYKQAMLQMTQSTFIFEGVTVEWFEKNGDGTSTNPGYQGLTHTTKVIYKDCIIKGCQFMYATEVEFINCEFTNKADYAVYCRGLDDFTKEQKVTFTNCTFNTGGKAILIYNDNPVQIEVELKKCTFNSDKSLDTEKAAVETGDCSAKTSVFRITIEDCSTDGNFSQNNSPSPLWGNKVSSNMPIDERLFVTTSLNQYDVTWKVEGKDDKTDKVTYGNVPNYGETPTKEPTAQYTYTFENWENEKGERFANENLPIVREDVTYTAVFTKTLNTHTVLWQDEDLTELEKDEDVPYGTMPSFDNPITPQKAEDEKFTYSFNGWNPELSAVEGDITYKATYTGTKKDYLLTWDFNGGDTTDTTYTQAGHILWGEPLEYPDSASMVRSGYTFCGWNETHDSMPTADTTIKARWAEVTPTPDPSPEPSPSEYKGSSIWLTETPTPTPTETIPTETPTVIPTEDEPKGGSYIHWILAVLSVLAVLIIILIVVKGRSDNN